MHRPLTRRAVWSQAWPIVLSQATTPLAGIVDTAVIGRTEDTSALAAVAVGVTVMNLLLWNFGFLRMGTTGLVSQAEGANDQYQVQATLLRATVLGALIGLILLIAQVALLYAAMSYLAIDSELRSTATSYAKARFWGAPFELAVYAFNGWLLGLNRSGAALLLQIVMNIANILFSVFFVAVLGLGPAGVGYGTAIAQFIACFCGCLLSWRLVRQCGGWQAELFDWRRLFAFSKLKRLLSVNFDIMIRTFALLMLFGWFTRAGARIGEAQLAANHVLMQIMTVAAFVLDAFAHVAEARVGQAIGAGSRRSFWRAVRLTAEFCLAAGALLGLIVLIFGNSFIAGLTKSEEVQAIATLWLPFIAIICVLGAFPWMLDGIFIGATRTAAMRNAAIAVTLLYVLLDITLRGLGPLGLWMAMTSTYILRGLSLSIALPGLVRSIPNNREDQ